MKPFKSVMFNEMELMERFGIDVTPINMAEAVAKLEKIYNDPARRPELEALAADTKKKMDCSSVDDELLVKMMTFVPFYKSLRRRITRISYRLSAGLLCRLGRGESVSGDVDSWRYGLPCDL